MVFSGASIHNPPEVDETPENSRVKLMKPMMGREDGSGEPRVRGYFPRRFMSRFQSLAKGITSSTATTDNASNAVNRATR